jgi:hypothetical protein
LISKLRGAGSPVVDRLADRLRLAALGRLRDADPDELVQQVAVLEEAGRGVQRRSRQRALRRLLLGAPRAPGLST